MTSAQVVETSVSVTNNSPSRDYSHLDDQTTQTTETTGFKPFTVRPVGKFNDHITKMHCWEKNEEYFLFTNASGSVGCSPLKEMTVLSCPETPSQTARETVILKQMIVIIFELQIWRI